MSTKQSTQQRRLEDGLQALIKRIEGGMEFPDACSKVALTYSVPYDALRDAYDDHCAAPKGWAVVEGD